MAMEPYLEKEPIPVGSRESCDRTSIRGLVLGDLTPNFIVGVSFNNRLGLPNYLVLDWALLLFPIGYIVVLFIGIGLVHPFSLFHFVYQ